VIHVVVHFEASVNDLRHPGTGPQVRGKPGRLRPRRSTVSSRPRSRAESFSGRPGPHRFATALAGGGLPAPYAP
jgi:hypothetical protein